MNDQFDNNESEVIQPNIGNTVNDMVTPEPVREARARPVLFPASRKRLPADRRLFVRQLVAALHAPAA